MKHTKRAIVLILALFVSCTGIALAGQTYTITEEEYKLLQMYRKLEEIKMVIDAEFLFEYDEEKLLGGAAQGMLGVLGDDYTYYYTPERMDKEQEDISGEYCGIGVEVQVAASDMTIMIRRVFRGGSAQKVGIREGDKILSVNGEEVSAYDLSKAVSMMRGEEGGQVDLIILRDKEILEFTCIRSFVETEILSSEILQDGIGYIRIYNFGGNAIAQLSAIVQDFINKDIKGVILDLRENPGGFVELAVQIANVFIDDGIIMTTEDKYGRTVSSYARGTAWDVELVCLVDEHSASSAEILAAALQENGVATLVGTQTLGKGIYQTVHQFYDGGGDGMQITSGYWLTPNGERIHKIGITPDVEVELPEDARDENFEIIREKDTQFQKALEIIKEKIQQENQ